MTSFSVSLSSEEVLSKPIVLLPKYPSEMGSTRHLHLMQIITSSSLDGVLSHATLDMGPHAYVLVLFLCWVEFNVYLVKSCRSTLLNVKDIAESTSAVACPYSERVKSAPSLPCRALKTRILDRVNSANSCHLKASGADCKSAQIDDICRA